MPTNVSEQLSRETGFKSATHVYLGSKLKTVWLLKGDSQPTTGKSRTLVIFKAMISRFVFVCPKSTVVVFL